MDTYTKENDLDKPKSSEVNFLSGLLPQANVNLQDLKETVHSLVIEIGNHNYTVNSKGDFRHIVPSEPKTAPIMASSLLSVVLYASSGHIEAKNSMIVVDSYDLVSIIDASSTPKYQTVRDIYLKSRALALIEDENYISTKQQIIRLNTFFERNQVLDEIILILSGITDKSQVTVDDDGSSSRVVTDVGVTTKATIPVKKSYALIPRCGFPEVRSPTRDYFIRFEGLKCAIIPFHQPQWEFEFKARIRDWLKTELQNEGAEGWRILT